MADPAIQQGQAWPALPPQLVSAAPGLPRVFLVEAGEQPPRFDPANVDPLRPETWRPFVNPCPQYEPPKAGAVALVPPPQGPGPAPASLAARGLRLLGRLLISLAIIMALGCKGCA
ncbi:MAG: hypothetical protein HY794_05890 [Desulfarculus sp.]|nr:hypothetical protein [Desulfarculus sp.]